MVQAIGFTAATLTALAFLPQALKVWRTRSSGDLSAGMLLAQSLGVALWIVYGVAIDSLPIIVSNAVTLALCILLWVLKSTYSRGVPA
jgi:MtN3 and saliva related transmembrane protein